MSLVRHLVTAFAVAVAAPVGADEVGELGGKVTEIDARVNEITAQLKPPGEPGPELAERRLIDAQVLYELKNYEAASIILFDVVEKYPTSKAYPEALYYLADSLYLKRDFLSSRRFFEKIVDVGQAHARYPEALQRLIELSLHTGDYSPVDGYIAKLDAVAVQRQLPSVPYVKGKYFYFRHQYDKALDALRVLKPDHIYFFHGTYFIGASLVASGPDKFDDAVSAFSMITKYEQQALDAEAKAKADKKPLPAGLTASQKIISELAHMALARIYLERGQLIQSLDEYSRIQQKSNNFSDMLYESAWVAIKGKDYLKARRQLDLLLLNTPDSALAPEVKLLLGSLSIRQQDYGPATDSFTKTRDEFEPIYKMLAAELQKTSSTPGYFRALIQKNLAKFDVAAILPPSTARWVKDEVDVQKLQTLIGDENDLKKSLDEAEDIVKRLEKILHSPARINVFPNLAAARAKATELANTLTDTKRKLAERQTKLVSPVVGAQKAQLDQLQTERARLESMLQLLPARAASLQEQQARVRVALNELDKRASEMSTEVVSLEKTFHATRKIWLESTKQKTGAQETQESSPPSADPGLGSAAKLDEVTKRLDSERSDVDKTKERLERLKTTVLEKPNDAKVELAAVGLEIERLRAVVDTIRKDILDAASSVGVDDADMLAAAKVRADYGELLKRQHDLVVDVQQRLGPDDRSKSEQLQSILDRAGAVDQKIASFNAKIDEILDAKLKDVQSALLEEKAKVAEFQGKLSGYTDESTDVGGAVMAENLQNVSTRFYNVVVRADVGIIDVAWALKDSSTRESNRLVAERKRELKLLDDEFKEVLKEQP